MGNPTLPAVLQSQYPLPGGLTKEMLSQAKPLGTTMKPVPIAISEAMVAKPSQPQRQKTGTFTTTGGDNCTITITNSLSTK